MENTSKDTLETTTQVSNGSSNSLKYIGYAGLTLTGIVLGLVSASILIGGNLLTQGSGSTESKNTSDPVEFSPMYQTQNSNEVVITTQGSATLTSEADKFTVHGTVKSFGLTSEESLNNANSIYASLNSYLAKENSNQAQLENISVIPEYKDLETIQRPFTEEAEGLVGVEETVEDLESTPLLPQQLAPYGYTTLQSFTVEVELDNALDILAGMVKVAPEVEINYTTQEVRDTTDIYAKALELAVQDAESKAERYASMLDVNIVQVRAVTEKNSQSSTPVLYSESSSKDFTPKTVDLYYTVEVIFVGEPN